MPNRRFTTKPPFRGGQINRSHPLAQYLRGFWLFNEGAGTSTINLAAQANDMVMGGTTPPTWANTQYGRGIDFTGVAANTTLLGGAGALVDNFQQLTWEVFVFVRALSSYSARLTTKAGDGTTTYNSLMIGSSGDILYTNSRATTILDFESTTGIIAANSFNHIIATLDKSNDSCHLYLNGVEVSYALSQTGSGAYVDDSARNLCFGNRPSADRTLNGTFLFARYYNFHCDAATATMLYADPYALLVRPFRIMVDVAAATDKSGSDSGTMSDSSSLDTQISSSDTAALSESSSLSTATTFTDTGALSETSSVGQTNADTAVGSDASSLSTATTFADTATLSETSEVGQTNADTATGSDASSLTAAIGQSDSGTLTDDGSTGTPISGSDSGALTESVPEFSKEQSESGAGSDASSLLTALDGTESSTGTDSSALSTSLSGDEAGTGSEASTLTASIGVDDIGTVSESGSTGTPVSDSDSGVLSEATTLSVAIDDADSATATDEVGHRVWTVDDTGSGSDSSSLGVQLAVADAYSGIDEISARVVGTGDSGIFADSTAGPAYNPIETETGVLSESGTVDITELKSGADTGALTDDSHADQGGVGSDSGTFAETASLVVLLDVTETAVAQDLSLIEAFFAGVDSGAGSELLLARGLWGAETYLLSESIRLIRDNQPVEIHIDDTLRFRAGASDQQRYAVREYQEQVNVVTASDTLSR